LKEPPQDDLSLHLFVQPHSPQTIPSLQVVSKYLILLSSVLFMKFRELINGRAGGGPPLDVYHP
jgi:hypothetical protein